MCQECQQGLSSTWAAGFVSRRPSGPTTSSMSSQATSRSSPPTAMASTDTRTGMEVVRLRTLLRKKRAGGVIYFGNDVTEADFKALMRTMEVQPAYVVKPSKDFAVFTAESEQPGKDGYLTQVRIVSRFGLRHMFGVLTDVEYEKFPEQELT